MLAKVSVSVGMRSRAGLCMLIFQWVSSQQTVPSWWVSHAHYVFQVLLPACLPGFLIQRTSPSVLLISRHAAEIKRDQRRAPYATFSSGPCWDQQYSTCYPGNLGSQHLVLPESFEAPVLLLHQCGKVLPAKRLAAFTAFSPAPCRWLAFVFQHGVHALERNKAGEKTGDQMVCLSHHHIFPTYRGGVFGLAVHSCRINESTRLQKELCCRFLR